MWKKDEKRAEMRKENKGEEERKGRNSRRNLAICPEQPPVGGGRN